MDTTVPDIKFFNDRCNFCIDAENRLNKEYYKDDKKLLKSLIEKIKKRKSNIKYDCVIGVSGGVDSSWVAYKVKSYGLNPLAVHFDNGWNSELAVKNIEKLLDILKIDLYTHVVDWDEFKDIQLSFLKSSIPNSEIPTDHGIVSLLYEVAAKNNIKYIIHGGNLSTESIMPSSWMHDNKDLRILKSIQKKFGSKKIRTLPTQSYIKLAWNILVRQIKYIGILNYIEYCPEEAANFLEEKFKWKRYKAKHFESIYTRFFQGYILPQKFSIDKRLAHLSSQIVSGQLTRNQAIDKLDIEQYNSVNLKDDMKFVCDKFNLKESELEEIMNQEVKASSDYPNSMYLINKFQPFISVIKRIATSRKK
tara:strand:- start:1703 stop:2788 length:1086 start_codon:yes stop_codon:yes gene_type:complete